MALVLQPRTKHFLPSEIIVIVQIKNLIFATLMIIAATLGGAKAYLDHRLGIELYILIKSLADIVSIEYADFRISLLGSVIINDLLLTTPDYAPVHINTVVLYEAYQFQLPQNISIAMQGIEFPISDTSSPAPVLMSILGYAPYYISPKELRDLGYTRVNIDVHLEAKSKENQLSLSGTVNAHKWGELRLSANLNNLSAPIKWTNATASRIKLTGLTVNYTNKGLINRIFTRLAQRNKMSLSNFKQALITKLKSDISQTRISLDADIIANIHKFIEEPQTVTLSLQPTSPITINALFSKSPKRLGLKMTTTKSN